MIAPGPAAAADRLRPPERVAVVDLDAIRSNVRRFVRVAAPARLMAVVKADAYGHGAVPVARAALEAGASWLGVAHIEEALALRAAGVDAPVLAWLHTPQSDFAGAIAAGVDLGSAGGELDPIAAAAGEQGQVARVHLKIDTGLGRNGSPAADWDALLSAATAHQAAGRIRVVGVFSHLAVADEPDRPETDEQLAAFREFVALAEEAGAAFEVRHLANTPATLTRPDTHFDLVRVGLGLYGLSPFAGTAPSVLGLRPAMTLTCLVAQCKDVPAGQGVSYGLSYRTMGPSALGLIPLGYADGIPRTATGGPVRVNGVTYPVVGRIAMDQMVIDLGEAGLVASGRSATGAEAVLFGPGDDGEPSVDGWAAAAGTNNYEIVTRISPRVRRRYLNAFPGAGDIRRQMTLESSTAVEDGPTARAARPA